MTALAAAQAWLSLDQDASTRAETAAHIARNDPAELETLYSQRLAFGTAGLRGPMRAGPNGMNALVVLQTTQGLASYISASITGAKQRGVVVGHDARHNSARFARLAAAALVAGGFRVMWLDEAPTPLVPFAVREYSAAAGVVVTASHNPKRDNGYKVYWENGCQIIPPRDAGIASAIGENLVPVTWDDGVVDGSQRVVALRDGVLGAYCDRIAALGLRQYLAHAPRFVYTPMHGVGLATLRRVLSIAGVPADAMTVVAEQADPDPEFSTVKFPNPEEAGALDLAIRTADDARISLIIANDPDADRLAVAERLPDGTWHQFSGNEVGVLLAVIILDLHTQKSHNGPVTNIAMLSSTVSSGMLRTIAQARGFHHEETLTGFKWLGNTGQALQARGHDVLFAFEEALGYMTSAVVWDKDGLSAAVLLLAASALWARQQTSLHVQLHNLYKQYGYFADANTYLISPSPATTNAVFSHIRALASPYPPSLGPYAITSWRDLTTGYDSATPDNVPTLHVDASAQMLTVTLGNGVRFTARGSGTEPKIKLYVEAMGESEAEARGRAREARDLLVREWFPESWGLTLPG